QRQKVEKCLIADMLAIPVVRLPTEATSSSRKMCEESDCPAIARGVYPARGFDAGHPALLRCHCRGIQAAADHPVWLARLRQAHARLRCGCAGGDAEGATV